MPLVYLGTGWFIGIALASALHLPIEFLLLALLVPIVGLVLWRNDRRARLIWISLIFAVAGGMWFTLRLLTSIRIPVPPKPGLAHLLNASMVLS